MTETESPDVTYEEAADHVRTEAGVEADPFRWTFNKGYFIQQHQADVPDDAAEPSVLYRAAYDIAPDQLQPYYVRFIVDNYFRKGETGEALAFPRVALAQA